MPARVVLEDRTVNFAVMLAGVGSFFPSRLANMLQPTPPQRTALQITFKHAVDISYVEVGRELPSSTSGHGTELFLYSDAGGGGRLAPLVATGVRTDAGSLQRVDVDGAIAQRLVVRGVFLALTVRVVGAPLIELRSSHHERLAASFST